MLTPVAVVLLLITGFVAGSFGGLLGLVGATVLVPALTLGFGLPVHMVIAISLISNVFVAITSTIGYSRKGLVQRKPVLAMNFGSVAGIVIGTYIATRTPGDLIKALFGIFLLFLILEAALRIAIAYIRKRPRESEEALPEPGHVNVPGFAILGFVMGVLGALLGIGGGTVAVPVQNVIFRVPLRNAIANSLTTIIVSASIGAVLYLVLSGGSLFSVQEVLFTAAAIVPGSIAGARSATAVAHRVPARYIKLIFYGAIFYVALNMIKSGMGW